MQAAHKFLGRPAGIATIKIYLVKGGSEEHGGVICSCNPDGGFEDSGGIGTHGQEGGMRLMRSMHGNQARYPRIDCVHGPLCEGLDGRVNISKGFFEGGLSLDTPRAGGGKRAADYAEPQGSLQVPTGEMAINEASIK